MEAKYVTATKWVSMKNIKIERFSMKSAVDGKNFTADDNFQKVKNYYPNPKGKISYLKNPLTLALKKEKK